MIEQLISFVENGGRIRENEEPKFGEPFYGEYMEQILPLHYKPGDRVKIVEKIHDNESKTYEGMIIAFGYALKLLVSGRKVHKDKRNKKEIRYVNIQSVEMVKPDDGSFDLSAVDPDEWEWNKIRKKEDDTDIWSKKTEQRRNQRLEDEKEFHQVYPGVDFDKSHVIKVSDGCSLYWPFNHKGITAEVFMVRDEDKITPIPCKTGTPFPNKNCYHAYNCKTEGRYPDLYLYLPDNGFRYEDVNIVCVWTINTTISGEDKVIKAVNIHHVGEIKPIKDEYNLIFVDMRVDPLLEYGDSLFTDSQIACLMTQMMNRDMYIVLDIKEDTASMVKVPEELTKEDLEKYLLTSSMAVSGFDLQEVIQRVTDVPEKLFPLVEVFCDIDKEPERYYSSSWRNCREGYQFKMLEKESIS